MKIGAKAWKGYFRIFMMFFSGALLPLLRDHTMPILQKVGFAAAIGLVLMPIGVVLAVICARLFGLSGPNATDSKPHDSNEE